MVGFNLVPYHTKRPRTDKFTFHYGRIQSGNLGLRIQNADLHSIMVGFNLAADAVLLYSPTAIYIPLWSDSIKNLNTVQSPGCKFTFHYGRIQSRSTMTVSPSWNYLHSIMVGFNHSCELGKQVDTQIYIPLWSDSIHDP